ncbi:MAG: T9SS type A sorting domain-containing protein [Bacteroidota bacterium]
MKFFPLLSFLFFAQLAYAQISIGTQWTYYQGSFLPPPWGTDSTRSITVVGDTIIDNKEYLELEGNCACSELEVKWIREENDQLFYYYNNSAHLLYDFNLGVGDMLEIYWPFLSSSLGTDSVKVHIDSVGQKEINGNWYEVQYIDPDFDPNYESEFGEFFIKGIGSNYCLFPQFGLCENTTTPLLCFGQQGGEILEFGSEGCQLTNTYELALEKEILLFPNPFQQQVNVQLKDWGTLEVDIYNMSGQLVFQSLIQDEETINLSYLPQGLYWVTFIDGTEMIAHRKLLKQGP